MLTILLAVAALAAPPSSPREVKVCRVTYERENRRGPVGEIETIECR
jgi:hypothetical protein